MRRSFTATFAVDAPARTVWRVLHPPPPPDSTLPRIVEYPKGSIEILNEGDEAGQGLVRTCVFDVPRYLLSGVDVLIVRGGHNTAKLPGINDWQSRVVDYAPPQPRALRRYRHDAVDQFCGRKPNRMGGASAMSLHRSR